ncbi:MULTISPECIES: CU044_2847 family protein [unclassified Micromonospora]|uniref:CU044_2847 family protein n=1 Tax=unclassified Micromonospora TaxID=2617518 RepID=UPI0022B71A8A|nr:MULTISPECIES: CU044_2847 family protein [unclassified Micromonospora]MCZ7373772.1 CU044_2847 family protein [Micromonospora sp. WMMC250]MDG4838745.1 CU044_2847 family protein [Micromonospora sp. WMMD967]
MTHVVAMPVDGGETVLIEVSDDRTGIERVGRPGEVVRTAGETLQQALARVRPAAEAVLDSVRGMAKTPDRVTVEFGIKLTAEAGVVVARTATEANFAVTVEWSMPATTEPTG